jgi:hypothetical protein
VHPVGSYYTDILRCTVHKTLSAEVLFCWNDTTFTSACTSHSHFSPFCPQNGLLNILVYPVLHLWLAMYLITHVYSVPVFTAASAWMSFHHSEQGCWTFLEKPVSTYRPSQKIAVQVISHCESLETLIDMLIYRFCGLQFLSLHLVIWKM